MSLFMDVHQAVPEGADALAVAETNEIYEGGPGVGKIIHETVERPRVCC